MANQLNYGGLDWTNTIPNAKPKATNQFNGYASPLAYAGATVAATGVNPYAPTNTGVNSTLSNQATQAAQMVAPTSINPYLANMMSGMQTAETNKQNTYLANQAAYTKNYLDNQPTNDWTTQLNDLNSLWDERFTDLTTLFSNWGKPAATTGTDTGYGGSQGIGQLYDRVNFTGDQSSSRGSRYFDTTTGNYKGMGNLYSAEQASL